MRIEGLHLTLGAETRLDDLTFVIPEGSIFLLLGPNGAGKTLLLRCLTGLRKPTKGRIEQRPPEFAWVPLSQTLPFAFSVREVLLMGRFARHQGYPAAKDESLIEAAARRVGVEAFLAREYNSLSRGEQTKVDIARALAAETSWIFLDEPFANLDIDASLQMRDLMRELRAEGRTLVLSHHDLLSARDLGTHGALLRKGKLLGAAPLSELLRPEPIEAAFGVRAIFDSEGRLSRFEKLSP